MSSAFTFQFWPQESKGDLTSQSSANTPHGIISKSQGWHALTLVSFLYCHLSYSGFTPKAKEMMAFPLTVRFEERLLVAVTITQIY